MAEINWNLLQVPDIGGNFMNALIKGQEMRRETDTRNALATILGGGQSTPGQTPGIGDGMPGNKPMGGPDPMAQAFSDLARADPATALQVQKLRQQQDEYKAAHAAAQQKAQAEHMQFLGRLLDHATDETSYQQALSAAKQFGIDTGNAPPSFDPQWVGNLKTIVGAYNQGGAEALSTFGKIATDEGFQPGSPQFAARVSQLVKADALKTIPYTQGGGVAGFNTLDGGVSTIVQPNPGGHATGAPVGTPAPTRKSVGGKMYEKRGDQWFEVGGAGSNAGGGFRP